MPSWSSRIIQASSAFTSHSVLSVLHPLSIYILSSFYSVIFSLSFTILRFCSILFSLWATPLCSSLFCSHPIVLSFFLHSLEFRPHFSTAFSCCFILLTLHSIQILLHISPISFDFTSYLTPFPFRYIRILCVFSSPFLFCPHSILSRFHLIYSFYYIFYSHILIFYSIIFSSYSAISFFLLVISYSVLALPCSLPILFCSLLVIICIVLTAFH